MHIQGAMVTTIRSCCQISLLENSRVYLCANTCRHVGAYIQRCIFSCLAMFRTHRLFSYVYIIIYHVSDATQYTHGNSVGRRAGRCTIRCRFFVTVNVHRYVCKSDILPRYISIRVGSFAKLAIARK